MFTSSIFIWSFILVGVILAAFVMVALIRRIYFQADNFPRVGFTIDDLRQLKQSGQMSAEEYEKARAVLIGQQMNKNTAKPPSDKPRQ